MPKWFFSPCICSFVYTSLCVVMVTGNQLRIWLERSLFSTILLSYFIQCPVLSENDFIEHKVWTLIILLHLRLKPFSRSGKDSGFHFIALLRSRREIPLPYWEVLPAVMVMLHMFSQQPFALSCYDSTSTGHHKGNYGTVMVTTATVTLVHISTYAIPCSFPVSCYWSIDNQVAMSIVHKKCDRQQD